MDETSDEGRPRAMSTSTNFRLGHGIGLVGPSTIALLEPVNAALAEALWSLIEAGAGIDELLEQVSTTGLRYLGSFVMVQFETDSARVVVRGSGSASAESADGPRSVVAADVRTWHEMVIDHPATIEIGLSGASAVGSPFAVQVGLVPAVAMVRGPHRSAVLDADAFAVSPLPLQHEVVTEASETAPPSSPEASPDPSPDPSATMSFVDVREVSHDPVSSEAGEAQGATAHPDGRVDSPSDEYDAIWGHTVARPVEAAAVRLAETDDAAPSEAEALSDAAPVQPGSLDVNGLPLPPSTPTPPPPPGAPTASSATGSSLIASVPVAAATPSTPAAPPTAAADGGGPSPRMGDHDGRTMTRSQINALRAQAADSGSPPPAMGGPSVQAVVCSAGHASPPHVTRCRVCGQAVSPTPSIVARPLLGSLRFSDGSTVPLDRPALVGRNPKLEGAMQGELPAVVRLDVGTGLSRSHALFRIEGWQVLVEDLNSANGTIVQLPSRPPQRLHPGEPMMLENGATIDFGGEITCMVELV